MGKELKAGSQTVGKHSLATHTKLKFRQAGQTNSSDVLRRDLRAELAAAERAAEEKKRKEAGLPPLPPVAGAAQIGNGAINDDAEDAERAKRRKILEEAADLDKDDSDDDDDDESDDEKKDKGKGKAVNGDEDEEEDEDDDDDSDE
jgi:protein CWC15